MNLGRGVRLSYFYGCEW